MMRAGRSSCRAGAALEVSVLKATGVDDRGRVDAVEVLQVGADVREAMLDRFDVMDSGGGRDHRSLLRSG